MKIGILMSNQGGSPLQGGLERGLVQLGHQVSRCQKSEGYDLIVVFNQCSHTTDYSYPEFPDDLTPIAFVDSAEYGYFKRLPEAAPAYRNAFSSGSMSHDTKNREQQERLKTFMQGRSFPYFLREYLRFLDYPSSYHPIDYPLYWQSLCGSPPNREEYLRRELDLFVYWGESHPWRKQLTQALRDCHVKCEIDIIGEKDRPRLPQAVFFNGTERAKCSVSYDGYGSSSFRLTEVLVRTVLLRGPLSMVIAEDLTDGMNCVDYNVTGDGETFISTDIEKHLLATLADPERAFGIYEAGYHHCMTHFTERATAQRFLRLVEGHDYTKPTPIEL